MSVCEVRETFWTFLHSTPFLLLVLDPVTSSILLSAFGVLLAMTGVAEQLHRRSGLFGPQGSTLLRRRSLAS
jgi:hypothetical protein